MRSPRGRRTVSESEDGPSAMQVDGDSAVAPADARRAVFNSLCARLNMDARTQSAAWATLSQIFSSHRDAHVREGVAMPSDRALFACALYHTGHSDDGGRLVSNGVSFASLMREASLDVQSFFQALEMYGRLANLNQAFVNWVHGLSRGYNDLSVIYNKFLQSFHRVFRGEDGAAVDRHLSLIWDLFLLAKNHSFGGQMDVVRALMLLASVFNFVKTHAANSALASAHALPDGRRYFGGDDARIASLRALAEQLSLDPVRTQTVDADYWMPYARQLVDDGVLRSPDGTADTNGDSSDPVRPVAATNLVSPAPVPSLWIAGLIDSPSNLAECAAAVRRLYEQVCLDSSGLDERLYLELGARQSDAVGTPVKARQSTPARAGAVARVQRDLGQEFGRAADPPATPLTARGRVPALSSVPAGVAAGAGGVPATPVSSAIAARRQFDAVLPADRGMPSALTAKLDALRAGTSAAIEARVAQLGNAFVAAYGKTAGAGSDRLSREYLEQSVKLFYVLLGAIVADEERRAPAEVIVQIITNEIVVPSLFAVAVETTLHAHGMDLFRFPWVLTTFDLKPFEFYRIIEPIVRCECPVMANYVRHLSAIEEEVLDSRAWEMSSPLHAQIRRLAKIPSWADVAPPAGQPGAQTPGPNVPQTPGHGHASSVYAPSPMRRPHPLLSTPSATPTKSAAPATPGHGARRFTSLELFFRRFYYLATLRIRDLCERLRINDVNRRKIWSTLENVVTDHTHLLFDRHLDQLIMCCVYGVMKVVDQEQPFKSILASYRQQPHAKSVYRSVFLRRDANDVAMYGTIIQFYNDVFMGEMRAFILPFGSQHAQETHLSTSPMPIVVTPKRVYRNHVTVSPLTSRTAARTPGSALRGGTPAMKVAYSIGESVGNELTNINSSVRALDFERQQQPQRRALNLHPKLAALSSQMKENGSEDVSPDASRAGTPKRRPEADDVDDAPSPKRRRQDD